MNGISSRLGDASSWVLPKTLTPMTDHITGMCIGTWCPVMGKEHTICMYVYMYSETWVMTCGRMGWEVIYVCNLVNGNEGETHETDREGAIAIFIHSISWDYINWNYGAKTCACISISPGSSTDAERDRETEFVSPWMKNSFFRRQVPWRRSRGIGLRGRRSSPLPND